MQFSEFKLNSNALLILSTLMVGAITAFFAAMTTDDSSIIVYAIAYAATFLAICWKYPHIGLAITFAVAPFQEDLSGGFGPFRFSIGESSLILAAIVFGFRSLTQMKPIKIGPTMIPVVLYLTIGLASSLATWHQDTVVLSMLQMVLYFVVATVVFSNFVDNPERLRLTLYALVFSSVVLAIAGLTTGSFFIWGLHKNGAGSSLACGLIVCVELWFAATIKKEKYRLSFAVAVITAGLLFTLSRGAWLAGLVGIFVVLGLRGNFRFVLQVLIVLVPLIIVCWSLLPDDKKDYATNFNEKSVNISARYESIAYARAQYESSPLYGVGVGLRKEFDATNIFWVCLAETGIPGLLAFAAIHGTFLLMVRKTQKFVPTSSPMYSLLVVGAGLVVARLAHGIVDHYWSRGALLVAWAGAGMSMSVYFHVRKNIALAEATHQETWRKRPQRIADMRSVE